jgi:hypothetical protein
VPWRVSSTVTTATAFPRSNGHVLASPGGLARASGGVERRDDIMPVRALARVDARSGVRACYWARRILASTVHQRIDAHVQQTQGSERRWDDTVVQG